MSPGDVVTARPGAYGMHATQHLLYSRGAPLSPGAPYLILHVWNSAAEVLDDRLVVWTASQQDLQPVGRPE